ncbi:autotransporter outer membrane beta-barrel domain-containing protein [Bdellovibrio sp. HCB185ZH]|uniref:autotransporter outer membrane beta-barrel domain-containing protein n=1 Tax=Bdellovibrio sp. HCB185ZH TaxID=3394235 RepID=UPI0039A4323E
MKSLWLVLVALLAVSIFHTANAQTKESAPKEPPFVEESEFEAPPAASADPLQSETDDALSIENEILQSGGEPIATPPQAPNTVDLNKDVPEAGSSLPDDLILEDEAPAIAAPNNEIPSSDAPIEEPVNVKPAPVVYSNEVVRKSPSGGVEYIHHPQAAVGLIRIEKDGTYVYKTKDKGEVKSTGSFRFGAMDAPIIKAADGVTTFETMYSGPTVPVLAFEYEWQPLKISQNLKVQAGFNLMMANGNGRFAESNPSGGTPQAGDKAREEYTFVAIPLNLGLAYRFQYMDRQVFAPYISGGGSYIPVVEYRDDGKNTNMVGTPAAFGGGGLLINIGAMDRDTAFTLRSEYGVTNLWVTLDYRYLKSFSEDVDFKSNVITAGVSVDY